MSPVKAMSRTGNWCGTDIPLAELAQCVKQLKKQSRARPIDKKIADWKAKYGTRLIQQLSWVKEHSRPISIWEIIGIETGWVANADDGYEIDPTFADKLVGAALEGDPQAFECARYLARVNIACDTPLPDNLRLFGAGIIDGQLKQPARASRPQINWYRDFCIVRAIKGSEKLGFV